VSAIVVDASVAAALFLDDPFSKAAQATFARAQANDDDLHAPDLLLIECASALWKRVYRGELDRASAMTAMGELARLEGLELHPMNHQVVPPALSIAIAHSITVYDAAYAALAVQLGGFVVTADGRFVDRAGEAGLPVAPIEA
jgi:predicted nucleic acid-binding protein